MFENIKDRSRLFGSILYFLVGSIILFYVIYLFGINSVFYNDAIGGFHNYPRLIWSLVWTFFGFALIAYRASKSPHDESAFPQYYLGYLLTLIMTACLVFAFFHIFKSTSNYLFYFLSGPTAFVLGYHADQAKTSPLVLFSLLK